MPRILLADDEEAVLDQMEAALRPLGHTLDRARDGREAMELAGQNDYDVVVADLVMPRRTGLDLIQTLRMRKISTPIVILSAYLTPDLRRELGYYERVEILSKPFKPDDLAALVQRLLAAPSA